jgi:hypothetical protein
MAGMSGSDKIIQLCEAHWENHKKDCSGFLKAVASELGISLTGQANAIIDTIQKSPWIVLGSGAEAQQKAVNGMLVVAGKKASGHGHVAIVVPGPLSHGKYPTAYWGSLGGTPKKNTTLNWSWSKIDRDDVIYAYRATMK